MTSNASADAACPPLRDPLKIASREPHHFDRSFALLSRDVYEARGEGADGWLPVSDPALKQLRIAPQLMRNAKSGFQARLYVHEAHGYLLAFRGTDEMRDWAANGRQGIGLETTQFGQASRLVEIVGNALEGRALVTTGHSLGGALASVAALRVGVPAVTFNAAGVHERTLDHLGISREARHLAAATGHVRRYTVENDILTSLQEHALQTRGLAADPIGHRIHLQDPDPLSIFTRLFAHKRLSHALDTHSMESVLLALDAPWQPEGPSQAAAALITQSIRGIQQLDGLRRNVSLPGQDIINAAVFVAARARESGMSRIDHMACSPDGTRLFAIQGSHDDPAQHRIRVDVDAAASEPAHRSATAVHAAMPDARAPPLVPRIDWQQAHHVLGH